MRLNGSEARLRQYKGKRPPNHVVAIAEKHAIPLVALVSRRRPWHIDVQLQAFRPPLFNLTYQSIAPSTHLGTSSKWLAAAALILTRDTRSRMFPLPPHATALNLPQLPTPSSHRPQRPRPHNRADTADMQYIDGTLAPGVIRMRVAADPAKAS
jgi:hypothetical protein